MTGTVVTGAAGFIGSHVAELLENWGLEIIRSDSRLPHKNPRSWMRAELMNPRDLLTLTQHASAVVHIGGIGDTYLAARDPGLAIAVNGMGTLNLLEAARQNRVPRFVYASTWEVYGPSAYQPVDELHPCFPDHPYSISKLEGDLLVQMYGRRYGLRTVVLRLGTAYGPRMRETAVIPAFLLKALRGEALDIQGTGQQFRQFTHVSDIARGFYRALKARDPAPVYNLVSPEKTTIRSLAESIADGLPVEIRYREGRAGDPPSIEVSSRLAMEHLGWKPEVSFAEGLRAFIEDYTKTPMVLETASSLIAPRHSGSTESPLVARRRHGKLAKDGSGKPKK